MPASAEVVSELAQRREAQFLFEVRVLLLFGRQNLPQGADLLLQLDVDTKRATSRTRLAQRTPQGGHVFQTYFGEFLLDLLSLLLCHGGVV